MSPSSDSPGKMRRERSRRLSRSGSRMDLRSDVLKAQEADRHIFHASTILGIRLVLITITNISHHYPGVGLYSRYRASQWGDQQVHLHFLHLHYSYLAFHWNASRLSPVSISGTPALSRLP